MVIQIYQLTSCIRCICRWSGVSGARHFGVNYLPFVAFHGIVLWFHLVHDPIMFSHAWTITIGTHSEYKQSLVRGTILKTEEKLASAQCACCRILVTSCIFSNSYPINNAINIQKRTRASHYQNHGPPEMLEHTNAYFVHSDRFTWWRWRVAAAGRIVAARVARVTGVAARRAGRMAFATLRLLFLAPLWATAAVLALAIHVRAHCRRDITSIRVDILHVQC